MVGGSIFFWDRCAFGDVGFDYHVHGVRIFVGAIRAADSANAKRWFGGGNGIAARDEPAVGNSTLDSGDRRDSGDRDSENEFWWFGQ